MKRTLIHNATIVNEGRSVQGSVVIEGDRIAEVLTYGKKLSVPCDETIDATGCYRRPCTLPRSGINPQSGYSHRKSCSSRRWCHFHHGYAEHQPSDYHP